MIHWIHHLLSPHCTECMAERVCINCDTLRRELEKSQRLNEQLLSKLLEKPAPVEEVKVETSSNKQIGKPFISWTQRRQMLEAESREAAKVITERNKELSVNDIESELGISPAGEKQ